MTKKDEQIIERLEGLLVKAVQAGKQETSGLVGELRTDIAVIKEHNKNQNVTLQRIENQTIKTNGRVGKLESHRSYLWGAYTVLTLIGGIIVWLSVNAIDNKIANGIAKALQDNVGTIEYE